ncbi:Putative NAD(P)H nitroreductase YdjA [Rosistilla ulvae]|uniref:Putative NAD(P)H nitroreductase n=1 Tax=Rosistilla ulvae TaxID=1930277 RepID=A0A517M502_9BACT|nr:nitroreductase [Rosistilla ulvae]QDS89947.1 Putative NAD(P)H nitroreductase YdjA [Rosistilla ulvae]
MQQASIHQLIRSRRTIKPAQMDPRPIAREVIETLLEDANWAPTHGLTEPWRFTIFAGDARTRLAQLLSQTYREITPPAEFKQNKFDSFAVNPTLAPLVIAIGMKRQPSKKISEIDEIAAVACAVQNIHLSATAFGLGGFWSSNAAACSDAIRDLMGLDTDDRVLGLFYLGYPASDWPAGSRQPIADKVRWESE